MSTPARATLQALQNTVPTAPKGEPVTVQFNPASLQLSRSNNVDCGGVTTGTERRQNPSVAPATLTFDLEFDTAEQGSAGARVDVRDWTAVIRQFVEPPEEPGQPPPAVRFVWGTLVFHGIVTQITEKLDYFAPDGTPLRASVSVSITEQNVEFEALKEGGASRDTKASTEPGAPPVVPGAKGGAAGLGTSGGFQAGSAKPDTTAGSAAAARADPRASTYGQKVPLKPSPGAGQGSTRPRTTPR